MENNSELPSNERFKDQLSKHAQKEMAHLWLIINILPDLQKKTRDQKLTNRIKSLLLHSESKMALLSLKNGLEKKDVEKFAADLIIERIAQITEDMSAAKTDEDVKQILDSIEEDPNLFAGVTKKELEGDIDKGFERIKKSA
ncbi:MAG: hypothetical protein AAB348_00585 [Patescibacteria group bacterium]